MDGGIIAYEVGIGVVEWETGRTGCLGSIFLSYVCGFIEYSYK